MGVRLPLNIVIMPTITISRVEITLPLYPTINGVQCIIYVFLLKCVRFTIHSIRIMIQKLNYTGKVLHER